ncbi:hypothetical protein [uncultured Rhodoblastus sp.]|uniref:hypothetical protein n=1 Tax=uncultured Rhodoblastus sp. TaxID=543037 RepID=UPI0025E2F245|nr:hypothetical protein [uncultured Rhodoblastus sp.]
MRRARRFFVLAPAFGALALTGASAQAAPANSLRELMASLDLCLKKSSFARPGEITLYFSLRQDGTLFGKPRVTYLQAPLDPAGRRQFLESVASAFDSCFPAQITTKLGMAIAGRPLSMRIVLRGPDTAI